MKILFIKSILIFLFLSTFLNAQNEKIDLLLKWHHQFQFAGYYMAKEKGYYNDVGLDVNMKIKLDENLPFILENLSSTYAVLDPIALTEQVKGVKIRALSAIFQQSPLVFLSLASSDIKSPQDFIGKRVTSLLGQGDSTLTALLHQEGINQNQFNLIKEYPSTNDLLENKTDVIAAYLTDAPYILDKKGYKYNIIDPLAYGIDFYGDMIFTSEQEAKDNPSRVKRFLAATYKGWNYALENVDETIQVILNRYKSTLDKETLEYEAKRTKELIMSSRIPIGMMNDKKINSTLQIFESLGYLNLTNSKYNVNSIKNINFNDSLEFWSRLENKEKIFLQNNPQIDIVLSPNSPPFYFKDKNNNPKGIFIDINKKLEETLGITLNIQEMELNEIIEKIKNKEIDLFYGNPNNHNKEYYFSQPLGTFAGGAFSKNKSIKIKNINDLKGYKVAVINNSVAVKVLSKIKEITLIEKKDSLSLVDSLVKNEVDIIIDKLPTLDYYIQSFSLPNIFLNGIFYEYKQTFNIGVKPEFITMTNILNKALNQLGQQNIDNIFLKWFKNDDYVKTVNLTNQEREFLLNNSVVKVGTDQNWPPFDFTKNKIAQGYSVDFYKLIEKQTNIHFEFVNNNPWHETVELFKNNQIDMLSIIGKNEERKKYTLFTSPILSSSVGIAYKKESENNSLETMNKKGLKLGVIKGIWLTDKVKTKYPNIKLVEYLSFEKGFSDLRENKLNGFMDVTLSLSYQINRNLLTDITISQSNAFDSKTYEKFFIGVNKNLPLLHSIIQKAVNDIPESSIIELHKKWFGNILEGSVSKKLLLTDSQKKFLFLHSNIKFGIDTSWAPFDFVDENGKYQGIVKDISNYIFKENLDLKINPIKQKRWSDNIKAIEDKDIDVIAGIVKSPQRTNQMLFSVPYLKLPLIVVGRLDETLIESLNDLEGKKIGVVKGYYTNNILKEKYPNIEIVAYNDAKSGLIDISRGKIDYFFDTLAAINYVIKEHGLTNLKLLGNSNENIELRYGIRKDWPEFQEILNKMINTLQKEKVHSILNNWVSLKNESQIDYDLLWKIVLSFITILLIIIYWNRKLSREIAQRKIVESKLKDSQIKAENANRAKSEFLSNMSHEIRTPMNAIIGFAELTSKMDLPSKAIQNIKIIHKSSKALVDIINDILDLSKIEAGKLSIQKKPTNIKNIAEDLYSIFSFKAESKNIFFDISFDNNTQKALIIDEVRLRQILINLIGNAIKFTSHGSVKVNFKTKENEAKNETVDLYVTVRDTGIGIKEEDKEKVFGMFEQQSSQDNRTYGGTGLGLSISLKLAQLMDGFINLESKQNVGSTFSLIVPSIEVASLVPTAFLEQDYSDITFEKATALIVDDIEENIDLLEKVLISDNLDVIKTYSGEESIKLAQDKLPDIILMDIKMPGMDGYEASNCIRKNKITSHIPIIAVSASVLGEDELKNHESSFDEFIAKPIDIDYLKLLMSKYLPNTKNKQTETKKTQLTKKLVLHLNKDDNEKIVETIDEFLNTGDLSKVNKVIKILNMNPKNNEISIKLENSVNNIDIDIIETELGKIKEYISQGENNEL